MSWLNELERREEKLLAKGWTKEPCLNAFVWIDPLNKEERVFFQFAEDIQARRNAATFLLGEHDTADDEAFHKFMQAAWAMGISCDELSREFGAARSTVERWIGGRNAPAKASRQPVYAYVRAQARKVLNPPKFDE